MDAVQDGKSFRLIGDNVNFMVKASHQRHESSQRMEHWFASAAIIQHEEFENLSDMGPQRQVLDIPPEGFLRSQTDWNVIRKEYVTLILSVLCKFCKQFAGFKTFVHEMRQEFISNNYDVTRKHTVVPLPVLPRNEQRYTDVIKILDSYEETVAEVYRASSKEVDDKTSVHIGGDQLNRERFSGAKRLRKHAVSGEERFEHLSPITFELFHLQMTILTMFYKHLYKKESIEKGTLHGEKIRLSRTEANGEDVKNHFDHWKELAVSLIDSYIVSAALEYFGMDNLDSVPTKNFIPVGMNQVNMRRCLLCIH